MDDFCYEFKVDSLVCDGYEKVVMKPTQNTSHSIKSFNHHYSFIQKTVVSMHCMTKLSSLLRYCGRVVFIYRGISFVIDTSAKFRNKSTRSHRPNGVPPKIVIVNCHLYTARITIILEIPQLALKFRNYQTLVYDHVVKYVNYI